MVFEVVAVTEVQVVENRDKNHGRVATDNACKHSGKGYGEGSFQVETG